MMLKFSELLFSPQRVRIVSYYNADLGGLGLEKVQWYL